MCFAHYKKVYYESDNYRNMKILEILAEEKNKQFNQMVALKEHNMALLDKS